MSDTSPQYKRCSVSEGRGCAAKGGTREAEIGSEGAGINDGKSTNWNETARLMKGNDDHVMLRFVSSSLEASKGISIPSD